MPAGSMSPFVVTLVDEARARGRRLFTKHL